MLNPTANLKVRSFLARPPRLFIDGEWHEAVRGGTIDVIDPATGETIAISAEGASEDIDKAVAAARRSFDSGVWRGMSGAERSRIIWRFADLIDANAEELVELEVRDNGMPTAFAQYIVSISAEWFRHFARLAANVFGRNASNMISGQQDSFHAYSARQPVGVVGLITPWNGPLGLFALKVGPALASGCSAIVKPAENTPLTALRVAELALEAGVPPGVLNVVTGYGHVAGAALTHHPDVDKISFTGSTAIGKEIVRAAADNLKRVTLELGGKSPCIICDDADIEAAIPQAGMAIFANTGQVCYAGSRLFVQRKAYDKVVAGLESFAKGLKIGSGLDPASQLGPLISEKQRERVLAYVESGKAEGAQLLFGGRSTGDKGFFVEPAIFANTSGSMKIVREEIFGPVLVATPFDDLNDVVSLANDTRYGLGAGIFTSDVSKAHLLASRIDAGNVWVNCYGLVDAALPFGGFKESGLGREAGSEGLDAYLEHKSVVVKLDAARLA